MDELSIKGPLDKSVASTAERPVAKERPIRIIRVINPGEEGSKVEVNQENLNAVLSRTGSLPLCIISICGPSRQGKSILLGHIIRYLNGLEEGNGDNWMVWETPNVPLEDIKFRGGSQGIWLWSKPFVAKIGFEGLPAAILVMDTEGMEWNTCFKKTSEKTMGLSMLLSSSVIFNTCQLLLEDVLMSLNSCIQFGQMALQNMEGEKPFQKLSFLIRDWNNPTEYSYGAKGGTLFLREKLAVKSGQRIEAQEIRKTTSSCFEHLSCYLMPHSGRNALRPNFQGLLSEVSVQYSRKLKEFLSSLVNTDESREVFIKRSFGKMWDQEDFRKNLSSFVSLLNSADIPIPISHFNAPIKIKTLSVMEDSAVSALEPAFKKWNNLNDKNFEDVAIGIDLGTTYSCVAAYISGKIRIIENDLGTCKTPCYVAFQPDGSKVVGHVAKQGAYENPENTIFDAKRILGRKFTDPDLHKAMKFWPFSVIDDPLIGGIPKIKVSSNLYNPERISASVLKRLKESAEIFLGKPVNKAVITVPACFNDGQRQATIDAGELAGLEVLSILTEPVAAAIAYKKQHTDNYESHAGSRNILIFDLGGGTFDVAILQSKHGELNVLAVDGNDHLGGEDFTRALMYYCAKEFKKQTKIDLFEGKDSGVQQTKDLIRRRLKRLQGECERCKIYLTIYSETEARLDNLVNTTGLSVKISRSTFEAINKRTFDSTIEKVVNALKSAQLEKHEIHDIVLVGGSTRIPKVKKMLHNFFGKMLDTSINPEEAVACGAAVQAAILNGAILQNSSDFNKIKDVIPMSIGVEINGEAFSVIIPKNTKVPAQAQIRYLTKHRNQVSAHIIIYQGEDPIAVNNNKLGDFYLIDIPPKAPEQEIDIEITISSQGILHVNAASNRSGGNKSITVIEYKYRMTKTLIKTLLGSQSTKGGN